MSNTEQCLETPDFFFFFFTVLFVATHGIVGLTPEWNNVSGFHPNAVLLMQVIVPSHQTLGRGLLNFRQMWNAIRDYMKIRHLFIPAGAALFFIFCALC